MAGMSRASRFGTAPDFLRTANRTIGVVLQLETPQAIAKLETERQTATSPNRSRQSPQ